MHFSTANLIDEELVTCAHISLLDHCICLQIMSSVNVWRVTYFHISYLHISRSEYLTIVIYAQLKAMLVHNNQLDCRHLHPSYDCVHNSLLID